VARGRRGRAYHKLMNYQRARANEPTDESMRERERIARDASIWRLKYSSDRCAEYYPRAIFILPKTFMPNSVTSFRGGTLADKKYERYVNRACVMVSKHGICFVRSWRRLFYALFDWFYVMQERDRNI